MPRVPKRQVGAGVPSAGFPGSGRSGFTPPSFSSGAAIADLGSSLSGAALTLGRIEKSDAALAAKVAEQQAKDEEKLVNDIDTNYATEASNSYRTARLDLDREAMSKSQKDVVGLRQDMLTKRLKLKSDVAGKFKLTGRRLDRYEKLVASGDFNFDKSVSTHELKQLETWRVDSGTTKTANAMEDGTRNVASLTDVIAAKNDIIIGVTQSLLGADQKTIDATVEDNVSKMLSDGIKLVASTNAANAKVYFDRYEKFLNSDVKTELNKLILKESIPQDGKDLADKILLETKDREEQNRMLDAEPSAEVGDAARKRVDASRKRDGDKAAREKLALYNDRLTKILNNKRDLGPDSEVDSLELTYVEDPKETLKLQANLKTIYSEEPVVTDPIALDRAYQKIRDGEYDTLGELRNDNIGKVSDADQKALDKNFQSGGLPGGVSYNQMSGLFKGATGVAPTPETSLEFMSAWGYVSDQLDTLPPSATGVDQFKLAEWMNQAVLRDVGKPGYLGFGKKKGLTYSQFVQTGTASEFNLDMDESDVNSTILVMENENERRRKTGVGKIQDINPDSINQVFLNRKRLRIPVAAPLVKTTPVDGQEGTDKPLSIRPLIGGKKFEEKGLSFEDFEAKELEELKAEAGGRDVIDRLGIDQVKTSIKRKFDEQTTKDIFEARGLTLGNLPTDITPAAEPDTGEGKEVPTIENIQANSNVGRDEALNILADKGLLGDTPFDDPAEEMLRRLTNQTKGILTIETAREFVAKEAKGKK